MRKLISFDDETYQALTQLSRDRMGTLQELADEAFRDLLKKHGIPVDLKEALRRSANSAGSAAKKPHSRKDIRSGKRSPVAKRSFAKVGQPKSA